MTDDDVLREHRRLGRQIRWLAAVAAALAVAGLGIFGARLYERTNANYATLHAFIQESRKVNAEHFDAEEAALTILERQFGDSAIAKNAAELDLLITCIRNFVDVDTGHAAPLPQCAAATFTAPATTTPPRTRQGERSAATPGAGDVTLVVGTPGPQGPPGAPGKAGAAGRPGPSPFPFRFTFTLVTGVGQTTYECVITSPTAGACTTTGP